MRIFRLIILLAIALAATPLDPATAQAPVKIRAGWVTTPASLIPPLFLKPGITGHYGKSYIFEPMYFASSTLQITAISQGELDLAAFGYTSFPLAIANAGLSDLRIVADEIQDGAPGYYSTPYFVRKDSGIDKIEDMTLRRHGLEVQRDYTMIEAPFPTHKEMSRPASSSISSAPTGRQRTIAPGTTCTCVTTSTSQGSPSADNGCGMKP